MKPDNIVRAACALRVRGVPSVSVENGGGGDDDNLKLSEARADSVRSWLVSHGVEAVRMTAKGYGRAQPVADNRTAEGRATNRRVQLAVAGCK